MEMKDMYFGILEQMKGYEPLLKEQEGKIAECEKAMEKIMAEQESAEKKLNRLKGRYDALVKMKEAYESVFGLNAEDEPKKEDIKETVETKETKTETVSKASKKELTWKHKSARLIAFDRNGNQIGNYATQAAAARAMNWDQSSISRFMKFGREEQIRKKNFYFKWEY